MSEQKHTPTPWIVGERVSVEFGEMDIPDRWITDAASQGTLAVATAHGDDNDQADANAAFIVRAVNAHEALVDALTLALPYVESALEDQGYKPGVVDRMTKTIRAALALAEAQQ